MHLGIEVKTNEIILVKISGGQSSPSIIGEQKVPIHGDSVQHCIDIKNSLEMLFRELDATRISLISCAKDSSKLRVVLEYIIQELAHAMGIAINTFATSQLNSLKSKTYPRTTGNEFETAFAALGLHKYSKNAFVVAWRFA